MRVLYSHYLSDDAHPAAQMVRAIARALRPLGHEVTIHRSAGAMRPAGKSKGESRTGARSRLRNHGWFAKELSRNRAMLGRDLEAIDVVRPDVILARQDAYCFSMVEAAKRRGIPLVTYADAPVAYETRLSTQHGGRWHPPGLVEAIESRTLRRSRAIVTVSEPAARCLSRYHVTTPIHVVSNGVDPLKFEELSPDRRLQERLGLDLTAPRIAGFVGSFKAFHGIDRLRDLILATSSRTDTQWLLIGDGPECPALQDALRGRANAVFLGHRPAAELGRLLGLMDVAVAPHPKHEGDFYFCPLKILEAAAAGCAVLASDQGDIPRLLEDGRAGVVLSDYGIDTWAQALNDLLDDPTRCSHLGHHARRWVMSHFTWHHTAMRVAEILITAEPTRVRVPLAGALIGS